MNTEIGGTFKWSEEQVEAYAVAFCEGDAIYIKNEGWSEVRSYGGADAADGSVLEVHRPLDNYAINHVEKSGYVLGYESGFGKQYRITTPKDYKVREGDKLVWLGETQEYYGRSELDFGKVYDVQKDGDHLIYKTDDTLSILARSEKDRWKFWGVIPRYENVKEVNLKNEETELIEEEEEMNGKDECIRRFKEGDRVKVKYGVYEEREGSVEQLDEVDDGLLYAVLLDSGRVRWFKEEFLELVEKVEASTEQQAFDLLADFYGEGKVRRMLRDKVKGVVSTCVNSNDFKGAMKAVKIAEQLEKGE